MGAYVLACVSVCDREKDVEHVCKREREEEKIKEEERNRDTLSDRESAKVTYIHTHTYTHLK